MNSSLLRSAIFHAAAERQVHNDERDKPLDKMVEAAKTRARGLPDGMKAVTKSCLPASAPCGSGRLRRTGRYRRNPCNGCGRTGMLPGGMTWEWRRKPLKSLKTDSAIRRLAVVEKENRSGEFALS
jgi:hypothetical protein